MIRFDNVYKKFSEQVVLQDLSFDLLEGEKVLVGGRSGVGKTTLFKLLLGFEVVDSGSIYYRGKEINETTVWELRRELAYVSQDLNIGTGKVLNFFQDCLSFKSNLKYKNQMQEEIKLHFDFFELPSSILEKNICDLSGGEKQRIAIINALLLNRKVFLLDEISSALDKDLKGKIIDYFLKNPSFTVLYISHDNYMPIGVDLKYLNLM